MSALRTRSKTFRSQATKLAHPQIDASQTTDAPRYARLKKLRATLRRHFHWHSAHTCAGVVESNVPLVSGGSCGISRAVAFHFRPGSADRPSVNLPQEPAQKFATM
jgi:hypothetical protein